MSEIRRLIEAVTRSDAVPGDSIARLIEIGPPAAPEVLDELRKGVLKDSRKLRSIILSMDLKAMLPLLLNLLDERHPNLKLLGYEAVGRSGDPGALQPLLDRLQDAGKTSFTRSLAAEALGELGDPRARDGLLAAAHELLGGAADPGTVDLLIQRSKDEFDEDALRLALAITVALAKLGDHQLLPVATTIALHRPDEADWEETTIRADAVRALQYVVGPSSLPTLREVSRIGRAEARQETVDALLYLGVKEAVPEFIALAWDKHESVAGGAYAAIYDLTGEYPYGKDSAEDRGVDELLAWWDGRQGAFESGVCYRLGKPLWPPTVINLLREPQEFHRVLRELHIITGKDFSPHPYVNPGDHESSWKRASEWFETVKDTFEAGQIYKYGFKQSARDIY